MVNAILIILVIFAVLFYIAYKIKQNQKAEKENIIEQDDQTYTLDKMIAFIKRRLDEPLWYWVIRRGIKKKKK